MKIGYHNNIPRLDKFVQISYSSYCFLKKGRKEMIHAFIALLDGPLWLITIVGLGIGYFAGEIKQHLS